MKRAKAVRIVSLISGISLIFSMASVYAAEEIHQTTGAEESAAQYERTTEGETAHESTETAASETENPNGNQISEPAESESQLENSTTGSEESESQIENGNTAESEESENHFESSDTTEPEESESQIENSTTEPEQSHHEDASETETTLEERASDTEESTEEMTEIADESGQIEKRWKAGTGLTSLRMPQKFEIVMDPWEMDGRTQIYSEQYIIKNTGDMPGTLKLTGIACETGEDVHVQKDNSNIHDGEDKKLYIELLINNEDRLVLMPEGTDYELKLAPDESITLEFTGEINENTPPKLAE